jgi:predicted unusual protein kinase regulating ubiquinone biosynthesis (AarF/ABC1/UbiB family)
LAEEMAPQLPKELDFVNEARNAERAAGHFKHRDDVVVSPSEHPLPPPSEPTQSIIQ